MKKLLFTFILFGMGMSFVNAQSANYKDFEWDVIKLGYVLPGGDNLGAGGMGGMEFRLNVRDDLSIGLRTETAAFDYEVDGDDFDVDATWSWAATADYYFNTTSAYRAYAGLGFGAFKEGNVKVKDSDLTVTEGVTSAGLIPRVGYEYNHLRLSAEYNIMMDGGVSNYFSISAALTLWGGYKGGSKGE